jgi:hypothetical protein
MTIIFFLLTIYNITTTYLNYKYGNREMASICGIFAIISAIMFFNSLN